jgi:hypothetical protein
MTGNRKLCSGWTLNDAGQKSYIRGCQVRNTSRLWNARNVFLTSSPCPSGRSSMLRLPCGFMACLYDGAISVPRNSQANLVAVLPTMVLSETRGLQLSWVMRGGIESAWRLGAEAHKSSNFWLDTLPRPERLKKKRLATTKNDPKGWNGLSVREMLKLLVVSVAQRRNELLSSRGSA